MVMIGLDCVPLNAELFSKPAVLQTGKQQMAQAPRIMLVSRVKKHICSVPSEDK